MFAVNCTTPANFYHVIRRQLKAPYRKPLVVFTPKSLLRHPRCTSSLNDLAKGTFQTIIDDESADVKKVERVVFCSGKFYYDLLAKKEALKDEKVALIRLEQLYPLPMSEIKAVADKYKGKKEVVWTQEEPKNMGAWSHILHRLIHLDLNFRLISHNSSASPAPGSSYRFNRRHQKTINQVFEF